MYRAIWRAIPAVLLVGSLTGVPAGTQTPRTAAPKRDEQAMAILKRMADFLSQTQRISVMVDIGFDVVQGSGEKIEFGETRKIVISRPDHARIDITKRDGATSGFIFDGKEIAVFNTREKVYATAAKPGTLDEAIDYFINDLDMRFPLAELFSGKLAETLQAKVRAASYVEQASIAGVPCDQVAFHGSYPVGAGLAVAGAVAVGTVITASAFSAMSCPMTPVMVGGYAYYRCGSTWYQPTYRGSEVTYVVVNPPQ
jgi:hypothetical protein